MVATGVDPHRQSAEYSVQLWLAKQEVLAPTETNQGVRRASVVPASEIHFRAPQPLSGASLPGMWQKLCLIFPTKQNF